VILAITLLDLTIAMALNGVSGLVALRRFLVVQLICPFD